MEIRGLKDPRTNFAKEAVQSSNSETFRKRQLKNEPLKPIYQPAVSSRVPPHLLTSTLSVSPVWGLAGPAVRSLRPRRAGSCTRQGGAGDWSSAVTR